VDSRRSIKYYKAFTRPLQPASRPHVPIIADIDAGFGNAEATYLLAKKMIDARAGALQIENQVSNEKQQSNIVGFKL
jgi:isocitrate lyase